MKAQTRNDALAACGYIARLYDLVDQWVTAGRPREGDWHALGPVPVWGESMSYERRPGPRTRYQWVREWAPMALIMLRERTLFVVIRGTVTRHDWSTNFRFQTRPLMIDGVSFGQVHDGFADSFESMQVDLLADVRMEVDFGNVDRVVISGHSLGGAVATLAFAAVRRAGLEASGLVFGSPRVGSPGFAQAFEAMTRSERHPFTRFEILADTVPRLPPSGVLGIWTFQHVGAVETLMVDNGDARSNHVIEAYRSAIAGHPVDCAAEGDGLARS